MKHGYDNTITTFNATYTHTNTYQHYEHKSNNETIKLAQEY